MDAQVVLPPELEFLEEIQASLYAIVSRPEPGERPSTGGPADAAVVEDLAAASSLLIGAGMDRTQAEAMSYSLWQLGVHAELFVRELQVAYAVTAREVDERAETSSAHDPFDIIDPLVDAVVRERPAEFRTVALLFTIAWLGRWGYSLGDVRDLAVKLFAFDPGAQIGERARAFRRIAKPAGEDSDRVVEPVAGVDDSADEEPSRHSAPSIDEDRNRRAGLQDENDGELERPRRRRGAKPRREPPSLARIQEARRRIGT